MADVVAACTRVPPHVHLRGGGYGHYWEVVRAATTNNKVPPHVLLRGFRGGVRGVGNGRLGPLALGEHLAADGPVRGRVIWGRGTPRH